MRSRFAILAGMLLGLWVPAARGESVSSAQVKQAAQRADSVSDGPQGQANQGTDHRQRRLRVLSLERLRRFQPRPAHRRGLVERKELQNFDKLLKEYSTRKFGYVMNDKAIQLLKTGGLPDDKMAASKRKSTSISGRRRTCARSSARTSPAALLDKHEADILKLTINPIPTRRSAT